MIDFYSIQEALAALFTSTSVTGLKSTSIEAMDRDMSLDSMPLINVRLVEGSNQARSIPSGDYVTAKYEVDVVAYHFTEYREAARIRDVMLTLAIRVVSSNRQFHIDLNTSQAAAEIRFASFSPEGAVGHVALATFSVVVEAYVDVA